MGFWEEQGQAGGDGVPFLTSQEKDALVAEGTPITIVAVSGLVPDAKFGGERYIVTFEVDGEDGPSKYGFKAGEVDSRDRNLVAMKSYLENGGDPVVAKLAPAGRGVTITAA